MNWKVPEKRDNKTKCSNLGESLYFIGVGSGWEKTLKGKRRGAGEIRHFQNTAQNIITRDTYTCVHTHKDRHLNVYLQLYGQTFGRNQSNCHGITLGKKSSQEAAFFIICQIYEDRRLDTPTKPRGRKIIRGHEGVFTLLTHPLCELLFTKVLSSSFHLILRKKISKDGEDSSHHFQQHDKEVEVTSIDSAFRKFGGISHDKFHLQ